MSRPSSVQLSARQGAGSPFSSYMNSVSSTELTTMRSNSLAVCGSKDSAKVSAVTTGIMALRSSWQKMIRIGPQPFARAVWM